MNASIYSFVGETYGKLTITGLSEIREFTPNTNKGRKQYIKYVECNCSCGKITIARLGDIKSGRTTSCGCAKKDTFADLKGERYHRLVAMERDISGKWLCMCDCGNTKLVKAAHLNNGGIRSCGCLRQETTSKMSIANLQSIREELGVDPETPLTDENTIQRSYFNKLAKEVLERDLYCCMWCNNSETRLNVHHIAPWQYNPELRFDRKNLITLCTVCHKSVHKFGYHKLPDPIMTILMEGYSKYIEAQLEDNLENFYGLQ